MITIVLGAVDNVEQIGELLVTTRRDIRNLIDRSRRSLPSWNSLSALLFLETDAISHEDLSCLGSDRSRQIKELLHHRKSNSNVVWLPCLHGIVGADMSSEDIESVLRKHWPHHNQIDVRAFHQGKSIKTNISNIINYANKHKCSTEFYDEVNGQRIERFWDEQWETDYYRWLHYFSRGFQSIKMMVNVRRRSI